MGKKNKIKKPSQTGKEKNIPDRIISQVPVNTDNEKPSFRFTYADKNRWTLSDWTPSELKDLIEGLKKIEKYTWGPIKSHGSKNRGQSVGTGNPETGFLIKILGGNQKLSQKPGFLFSIAKNAFLVFGLTRCTILSGSIATIPFVQNKQRFPNYFPVGNCPLWNFGCRFLMILN